MCKPLQVLPVKQLYHFTKLVTSVHVEKCMHHDGPQKVFFGKFPQKYKLGWFMLNMVCQVQWYAKSVKKNQQT